MNKIPLGKACNILNGYAFKSEKYVNSGYRVIRITNVQKGFIEDEKPQFYPVEEEANIKDFILEENDLLLSLTGNVGRVAILEKKWLPASLNQRVACLRVNNNELNKKYIYYALLSSKFEEDCITSAKGIAQKNMSTEWLKEYAINVPTLEKQVEIVKVFDKLSSIISSRKEELDQLDILVKARFVEMFENKGYPVCKLSEYTTKITDGTHKTPNYLSEGVVFISAINIVNGKLNFSDVKHISKEEYDEIQKRCELKKGDILLSKSGSLGAPVVVETDECLGLFESLAVLKGKWNLINNIFLCEQLKSQEIQRQFKAAEKGIAVKHLHLGVIANTNIIVSPIDLQNQFADFVHQVDKSKAAIQKSLDETQLLFDSLMQKYFG